MPAVISIPTAAPLKTHIPDPPTVPHPMSDDDSFADGIRELLRDHNLTSASFLRWVCVCARARVRVCLFVCVTCPVVFSFISLCWWSHVFDAARRTSFEAQALPAGAIHD